MNKKVSILKEAELRLFFASKLGKMGIKLLNVMQNMIIAKQRTNINTKYGIYLS